MLRLLFCLGLIQLTVVFAQQAPPSLPSPGCPDVTGAIGTCGMCPSSGCPAGTLCCRNGCGMSCMRPDPVVEPEDPCERCGDDEVCELRKVFCISAPCPPLRMCVPKPKPEPEDPCKTTKCPEGQICEVEEVECVTAPCPSQGKCVPERKPVKGKCPRLQLLSLCRAGHADECKYDRDCPSGELCCRHNSCSINFCMQPEVLPNPCELIDCHPGFRCLVTYLRCSATSCPAPVGECKPFPDLCAATTCLRGQKCVVKPSQCTGSRPCPAEAVCETTDPCATVKCGRDTECVDGKCVNVCELPSVPGPCKGYMPRFYYDSETKTCKRFIYGGCQGNKNNFLTSEQCEQKCGAKIDLCSVMLCGPGSTCVDGRCISVCQLPQQPGPCEAYMPRFAYDSKTKTCKQFIYGGCQGNGNNFQTAEECEKTCDESDPCSKLTCAKDEKCILLNTPCARGAFPCKPQPVCQKINPCAGNCYRSQRCLTQNNNISVCVPKGKPGGCPRETGPAICDITQCSHDYDCKGRYKCCRNGCGSMQCRLPGRRLWPTRG